MKGTRDKYWGSWCGRAEERYEEACEVRVPFLRRLLRPYWSVSVFRAELLLSSSGADWDLQPALRHRFGKLSAAPWHVPIACCAIYGMVSAHHRSCCLWEFPAFVKSFARRFLLDKNRDRRCFLSRGCSASNRPARDYEGVL